MNTIFQQFIYKTFNHNQPHTRIMVYKYKNSFKGITIIIFIVFIYLSYTNLLSYKGYVALNPSLLMTAGKQNPKKNHWRSC